LRKKPFYGKKVEIKMKKGLLVACVLFILTACSSKPQSAETIRVVLDWTPNTNHTGLYVAQSLGYYEKSGLTVEILQPPEDGALALLGAGKAEFAIDFQESTGPALALEAPLPVTAVAGIISHNTSGIISLKEDGILSPKGLEGKRFSCWSSPLVDAIMRKIVTEDGGDIDKVTTLPNTVTDVVSALSADVDAVWIYAAWDGIATELSGLETNYFDFATLDPVLDFYTPILVANNTFLKDHPTTAKAFLDATSRGYQYAIENPEQAGQILLKAAPELSEDLVLASQAYLADKYQGDAKRWGEIDPVRWAGFYGWMYDQGLLERDIRNEGFSNEYLPG
jgi:ABC-type nitrate/sulfonate/bicarbonate transport system substrate-binding protein